MTPDDIAKQAADSFLLNRHHNVSRQFEQLEGIIAKAISTALAEDRAGREALQEDVRAFIYGVTLHLQRVAYLTKPEGEEWFHKAYKLYSKYDVEGIRAATAPAAIDAAAKEP